MSPMTSPLLEARHLVKRFHGITVVDDVSFVVHPGEVVGYLGPNGSGKTTTGRMLTGLVEPSGGSVIFDGRNVSDDPIEYRRRLGYVPEEPTLYPFLSAREQLRLLGRLRELPPALMERKLGALLELFGMADAAEQSISAYSKGMRQKVLIIAALLFCATWVTLWPHAARRFSTARTSSKWSRSSARESSCCTAGASSRRTRCSSCAL